MDDRIANLVAQYELEIYSAGRSKGAWILETRDGIKRMAGCNYSEGKLCFEQRIKQHIRENGYSYVDCFVPAKEGTFLVQGPYNEQFVMSDWFLGDECDVKDIGQTYRLAKTLALLHTCLSGFLVEEEEKVYCTQPKVPDVLEKRNRELRRVRSYIREKKQKSCFEQKFLSRFSEQYEMAEHAKKILDVNEYAACYENALQNGTMLHGNFTHHSVIMLPEGEVAVTGFDRAVAGIRIHDFYQLFRKMMEKWDWDVAVGDGLLENYEKIRSIPAEEYRLLKVLVSYPEKFWKVANQYYNNRKSWIPEKNMQKLLQTMEQAKKKEDTIRRLFGT